MSEYLAPDGAIVAWPTVNPLAAAPPPPSPPAEWSVLSETHALSFAWESSPSGSIALAGANCDQANLSSSGAITVSSTPAPVVDLSEVLSAIAALNAKVGTPAVYMDARPLDLGLHPNTKAAQEKRAAIEANNAAILAFVGSLINRPEVVE